MPFIYSGNLNRLFVFPPGSYNSDDPQSFSLFCAPDYWLCFMPNRQHLGIIIIICVIQFLANDRFYWEVVSVYGITYRGTQSICQQNYLANFFAIHIFIFLQEKLNTGSASSPALLPLKSIYFLAGALHICILQRLAISSASGRISLT